jgi:hypothetical protein
MSALASFVSGRRTTWVVIAQACIHATREGVVRAPAATGPVITSSRGRSWSPPRSR